MKKKLGLIIGMLMCFSIMTVGFAAWIITGDSEEKTATGNFTAQDVSDRSLGVEIVFDDNSMTFGVPTSTTTAVSWLSYDDSDPEQDFEAKATITVTNYEYLSTLNVSVVCEDDAYTTALSKNLITAISCEVSPTVSNTEGTYTVTITIGWGSAFGGQNPFDYYNKQDISMKQEAHDNLKAVYALNGVDFVLKVQAMDANSSNNVTPTPIVEPTEA